MIFFFFSEYFHAFHVDIAIKLFIQTKKQKEPKKEKEKKKTMIKKKKAKVLIKEMRKQKNISFKFQK